MSAIDTLSHGFWTYYVFRHQTNRVPTTIGGILPDCAMYVVAGNMLLQGKFSLFKSWLPQIFSQPGMWTIDSIMHSIPIWLLFAILGLLFHLEWLKWFVIGGLFHITIDIFTHKQYIDAYLWPLNYGTVAGVVDYHTPVFTAIDCTAIFLALLYVVAKWSLQKIRTQKIRVR